MTAGLKLSNWPAAPGCHCGSGKPYAPRRCRLPAESRAEESAAYAIDYREAAPVSIRAAIDNIVGSVKAWLQKTFGVQLGSPTPGELVALAKAALRDGWEPTDGGPDGGSKENCHLRKRLAEIVSKAFRADSGQVVGLNETIGPAESWLVRLGKRNGIDLTGYTHSIDGSAIKHIYKVHTRPTEKLRGQVPVEAADFLLIPEIISSPDVVVLGFTTSPGQSGVGYIKKINASTTIYVEEARSGQRLLATTSLRKYRSSKSAIDLATALVPNARDEGSAGLIVVDMSEQGKGRKFNKAMPGGTPPAAPPKLTMRERTSNLLTSAMRGDSKGDYGLLSMTPLRQLVQEVAFPFQTPRGRPLIHAGPQEPSATSALRPVLGHWSGNGCGPKADISEVGHGGTVAPTADFGFLTEI